MRVLQLCLLVCCLVLNIGYSASQFRRVVWESGYDNSNSDFGTIEHGGNTYIIRSSGQPSYRESVRVVQPSYRQNVRVVQPSYQENVRSVQPSSGNCDQFWSYASDYNGQYGVIKITRPNYRSNKIRVALSVAAQLPSVRIKE